jgi:hypothetical protein
MNPLRGGHSFVLWNDKVDCAPKDNSKKLVDGNLSGIAIQVFLLANLAHHRTASLQ